jgi:hypothetical protein
MLQGYGSQTKAKTQCVCQCLKESLLQLDDYEKNSTSDSFGKCTVYFNLVQTFCNLSFKSHEKNIYSCLYLISTSASYTFYLSDIKRRCPFKTLFKRTTTQMENIPYIQTQSSRLSLLRFANSFWLDVLITMDKAIIFYVLQLSKLLVSLLNRKRSWYRIVLRLMVSGTLMREFYIMRIHYFLSKH